MKFVIFCLGLVLLSGCGKGEGPQSKRQIEYPPLNESPPPLLLPESSSASQEVEEPVAPPPAVENAWMQQRLEKEEQIKNLRKYAAKAAPGDSFALTEEEIDELSKTEGRDLQ